MSGYIINSLHHRKRLELSVTQRWNSNTIALLDKAGKTEKFISLSEDGDSSVAIDPNKSNQMLYPVIPSLKFGENFLIYIYGSKGNGKSTFAYIFAKQYEKMYKNNKIYFISNKKSSDDQNMRNVNLHQLTIQEMKDFEQEHYKDCLFIVDDIDYGEIKKPALDVVNKICTLGRQYKCSLIYISHVETALQSSIIYKVFDIFITFPKHIEGSVILKNRLHISDKYVMNEIINDSTSYLCFNTLCEYIITNNVIDKFRRKINLT